MIQPCLFCDVISSLLARRKSRIQAASYQESIVSDFYDHFSLSSK
jgi:hypothetical protein